MNGGVVGRGPSADAGTGVEAVDIVIVGGGIAGLVAAEALERAGVEWRLLEARDRLGGRTQSVRLDADPPFEAGGEFVKPGHRHVRGLLDRLGVRTVETVTHGRDVFLDRGRRDLEERPFGGEPATRSAYESLHARARALAARLPDDVALAEEADARSLASFAAGERDGRARRRFERDLSFGLAGAPGSLSLLTALDYFRAADPDGAAPSEAGSQGDHSLRIAGGGSAVADALSARLPAERIRTGSPVRAIRADGDGVRVTSADGIVTARRCILAMSPGLARSIDVDLDGQTWADSAAAVASWDQGCAVKAQLRYHRRWWLDRGLSGSAEGDLDVAYVLDTSPGGAEPGDEGPGYLTLLANDRTAVTGELRGDRATVERRLLADLETYFGEVPEPVSVIVHRWSDDPLAGGCGSPLPVGAGRHRAAIRDSSGPVVWAGTEASPLGWGSIEGAVVAGQRAAEASRAAIATDSVSLP